MQAIEQSVGIGRISSAPTKVRDNILTMAKALPKTSTRNYGTVLGFRNGKAAITSGYALLEYTGAGIEGEFAVTKNLLASDIKFPNWEGVIPTTDMVSLGQGLACDILALLGSLSAKQGPLSRNVFMGIKGKEAFIFRDYAECDVAFNPWVIKDMAKGLPKNISPIDCQRSLVHTDGPMVIGFGDFKLVCVPVKMEKPK